MSAPKVSAKEYNNFMAVEVSYWLPSSDADVRATELSVLGTNIDVENDLGIDDSPAVTSISASFNLVRFNRFVFSFLSIEADGNKDITRDITFKGRTYSVGENVSSSYEFKHYEGYYEFIPFKQDAAELGVLVGVKYIEIDSQLTSNTSTISESASVKGPLPIVGVQGEIRLPYKFQLSGVGKGFIINYSDSDFKLIDIVTALNYDINNFLRATVGYRYFLIDAEDGDNKADIEFTGPVVGLTGSF